MADPTTPTIPVKPIDPNAPSQQAQQNAVQQETPAPKKEPSLVEKPLQDLFQSVSEDLQSRAEHQLRTPAQFGRKIPVGPESPPARPSIDPRPLLNDPLFRNPQMRDTPLYRHLQARTFGGFQESVRQNRQESLGRGISQNNQETRQNLRTLLVARNLPWEGDNKPLLRQLIREEMSETRESRESHSRRASHEPSRLPLAREMRGLLSRLSEAASSFESMLRDMFSGQEMAPQTPSGRSAVLTARMPAEWSTFFSNLLRLGNAETPMTRSQADLVKALFRGVYQKTLVSDLNFTNSEKGEKVVADKFARILIDNPDLLRALQEMKPGETLPPDLLAKLGDEIRYIQMTHLTPVPSQEARDAARDAGMAALRNPANAAALSLLEKALKREREYRRGGTGFPFPSGVLPFLSGNSQGDRERWGKGKFWIYFAYSVTAVVVGLVSYNVLKFLF